MHLYTKPCLWDAEQGLRLLELASALVATIRTAKIAAWTRKLFAIRIKAGDQIIERCAYFRWHFPNKIIGIQSKRICNTQRKNC